MKFRNDRDILKFIGISLSVVLFGILILLLIQPLAIIGVISITSGLVGFIIGLRLASRPKDYFMEDERSIRIREKAGYNAYGVISTASVVIMLLNVLKISPSLTPSRDLADGALLIWVTGLYSFLILRWYYNKKGE